MHPEQGKDIILDAVVVSRADIAAAKTQLVDESEQNTRVLVERWAQTNGGDIPSKVMMKGEHVLDDLKKVARALSLRLAGYYAVWELIASGYLMPAGQIEKDEPHVEWTTITPGSGGRGGGWSFPELTHSYPVRILRHISTARRSPFTDGDLYLQEMKLENLHPGIEEALTEAARCFRYDLYTSAVAMLGAASEGVWIELGRALVAAKPSESKVQKVRRELDTQSRGIGSLVKAIEQACEDQAQTGDILKAAEVTLQDVRIAVLWWDTVRESRNVLHWGAEPTITNNFDKVSVLMLSATPHLRTLWEMRNAALKIAQSTQGEV